MRHQAEFLPTVLLLVWLWFHRVARTDFSSCDFNLDGVILERGCMLGVDLRFNIHLTELSYRRLSKHVRLSDLSLGTRPRYSLVVDEDVKKPTNQPTNQPNKVRLSKENYLLCSACWTLLYNFLLLLCLLSFIYRLHFFHSCFHSSMVSIAFTAL